MTKDRENGSVEVEATFILPIAILCVILLLYISLLLFQRANLQAYLEICLLYYKNSVTDTYVVRNDEISYVTGEDVRTGRGNSYYVEGPLDPYTSLFRAADDDNEQFEKYFKSVAGKMLFDDSPEVTMSYRNYFLVKQYEATAHQTVILPIDFSIIGLSNRYEITATAKSAVSDHDGTIRTLDFIIDIVEDTAVGDFLRNISSKVGEVYGTMKEKLGIS